MEILHFLSINEHGDCNKNECGKLNLALICRELNGWEGSNKELGECGLSWGKEVKKTRGFHRFRGLLAMVKLGFILLHKLYPRFHELQLLVFARRKWNDWSWGWAAWSLELRKLGYALRENFCQTLYVRLITSSPLFLNLFFFFYFWDEQTWLDKSGALCFLAFSSDQ